MNSVYVFTIHELRSVNIPRSDQIRECLQVWLSPALLGFVDLNIKPATLGRAHTLLTCQLRNYTKFYDKESRHSLIHGRTPGLP